jgi:hypothetical protein
MSTHIQTNVPMASLELIQEALSNLGAYVHSVNEHQLNFSFENYNFNGSRISKRPYFQFDWNETSMNTGPLRRIISTLESEYENLRKRALEEAERANREQFEKERAAVEARQKREQAEAQLRNQKLSEDVQASTKAVDDMRELLSEQMHRNKAEATERLQRERERAERTEELQSNLTSLLATIEATKNDHERAKLEVRRQEQEEAAKLEKEKIEQQRALEQREREHEERLFERNKAMLEELQEARMALMRDRQMDREAAELRAAEEAEARRMEEQRLAEAKAQEAKIKEQQLEIEQLKAIEKDVQNVKEAAEKGDWVLEKDQRGPIRGRTTRHLRFVRRVRN